MKKAWRLWAKALGTKEGLTDSEANTVAAIRTVIVLINTVCAVFIMTNIVHTW